MYYHKVVLDAEEVEGLCLPRLRFFNCSGLGHLPPTFPGLKILETMPANRPRNVHFFTYSGKVTDATSVVRLDRVPQTLPLEQQVSNRTE